MPKFTDWLELSVKKDLEAIKKKLSKKNYINLVTIIEIILMVVSAINLETQNNWLNITLLVLAVVTPIVIGIIYFIVERKKFVNDSHDPNFYNKIYIDDFDNEICIKTIMADELLEQAQAVSKGAPANKKIDYYLSEMVYYTIKATQKLNLIISIDDPQRIFSEKYDGNKIQMRRLKLICDILYEIYEYIIKSYYGQFKDEIASIKNNMLPINKILESNNYNLWH